MNTKSQPMPTFRGRNLGLAVLIFAQCGIGILHVGFGMLLFASNPDVYSSYTLIFSALTILFAYGLWKAKRWGWIGTVSVAVFVIAADSLTLLNLLSILGIPKFAGYGEIPYSILVLLYLSQTHIRSRFNITFHERPSSF